MFFTLTEKNASGIIMMRAEVKMKHSETDIVKGETSGLRTRFQMLFMGMML